MRRKDDSRETVRSYRSINSTSFTPTSRPQPNCRGEGSRVISASHRPSLARNAEERSRRILEIRRRFDSQSSSTSVTSKCAEVKKSKPMGGIVSSSRSKLLGRKQLRNSTESKRTVVMRNGGAGEENECDLKRKMHQIREKFDSASEELQANEQELTELREALNKARRGSSVLSAQNTSYVEKVDSLKSELEKSRKRETQLHVQIDHLSELLRRKALAECDNAVTKGQNDNKENCALQRLAEENERLRAVVSELNNEKGTLEETLRKAKEDNDRLTQEIIQLNSLIEVEREEWDHMQADLLVAVRVANDFKMEAQEEMKSLYAKIADLQKRRQSNVANVSASSVKLFDDRQQSWEDVAWQRLMRRCERGPRRNELLYWCQQAISSHANVKVTNFSTSWADGKALCYLFATFYPEKIDAESISSLSDEERINLALDVGRRVGVEIQLSTDALLNAERPDWKLVMKYILNIYYLVSAQE